MIIHLKEVRGTTVEKELSRIKQVNEHLEKKNKGFLKGPEKKTKIVDNLFSIFSSTCGKLYSSRNDCQIHLKNYRNKGDHKIDSNVKAISSYSKSTKSADDDETNLQKLSKPILLHYELNLTFGIIR